MKENGDELETRSYPPFIPHGLWAAGAFYLPSDLNVENEIRLLLKILPGAQANVKSEEGQRYYEAAFSKPNEVCRLELLSIKCGPKAELKEVRRAIHGTFFESVQLEGR